MPDITITGTYKPGDLFYACPLNTEYLQAKAQAGEEVVSVTMQTSGLRDDASFTHTSVWRPKSEAIALAEAEAAAAAQAAAEQPEA